MDWIWNLIILAFAWIVSSNLDEPQATKTAVFFLIIMFGLFAKFALV